MEYDYNPFDDRVIDRTNDPRRVRDENPKDWRRFPELDIQIRIDEEPESPSPPPSYPGIDAPDDPLPIIYDNKEATRRGFTILFN